MPRAKAIQQSEFPYSITARTINKDWFNLPMSVVWEIFCEELKNVHNKKNLVIHSFVLMQNHFHLLASTPDANISQCMHQLMHNTSRKLTKAGNRINQTYSGRHYKCILQHTNYYLNTYKYNYRNPVSAGVCKKVEDYPYSTLQAELQISDVPFPISKNLILKRNPIELLSWLNTAPHSHRVEALELGLKHQFFKSKKDSVTNKPLLTENDLI